LELVPTRTREEPKKELRTRKKNQRDAKILRRLLCIELKDLGEENAKIATLCGVCRDTITDWLRLFEEKGFDGLCSFQYDGRRLAVLDVVRDELKRDLKAGKHGTLKEVKRALHETHGIDVCISWIWRYAKKTLCFLQEDQADPRRASFR
jgi:transposase